MTSERKIRANRANARKSTGPRTIEGKSASRRNALTHGLSARQLVLEGESPGEMEFVIGEIITELAPETMMECQIAEQIAQLIWRLRRIPALESALFAWMGQRQMELYDSHHSPNVALRGTQWGDHRGLREDSDHSQPQRAKLKIGRLVAAAFQKDLVGKLGRYEAHLLRQLPKLRAQFEALKSARESLEHEDGPRPD